MIDGKTVPIKIPYHLIELGKAKAAEFGFTFAEYVRALLYADLATPENDQPASKPEGGE